VDIRRGRHVSHGGRKGSGHGDRPCGGRVHGAHVHRPSRGLSHVVGETVVPVSAAAITTSVEGRRLADGTLCRRRSGEGEERRRGRRGSCERQSLWEGERARVRVDLGGDGAHWGRVDSTTAYAGAWSTSRCTSARDTPGQVPGVPWRSGVTRRKQVGRVFEGREWLARTRRGRRSNRRKHVASMRGGNRVFVGRPL
jgi:hypothetical protein